MKNILLTLGVAVILTLTPTPTQADCGTIVFSKTNATMAAVTYTINDTGVVTHLICDLDGVGTAYTVLQDGIPINGSPFTVTVVETIGFQSNGGGVFTITRWPYDSLQCMGFIIE